MPPEAELSDVDPPAVLPPVVVPPEGAGSVVAAVDVDPPVLESVGAVGAVEVDPAGVLATDTLSPVGLLDTEGSGVAGVDVESVGVVAVESGLGVLGGATDTLLSDGGDGELLGAGAIGGWVTAVVGSDISTSRMSRTLALYLSS